MFWCLLFTFFCSSVSSGLQSYSDFIPIHPGHNSNRSLSSKPFMYITTHKNYPSAYSNRINSSLTLTGFSQYPLFKLEFMARNEFEMESFCNDYIHITGIKGPDLICGGVYSKTTLHFSTTGDEVTFSFVTNESRGYFGVLLNFTAIYPIHLDKDSNRAIPSQSLMYIATHKSYPAQYSTEINSSLTLSSIPPTSTITIDFLARAGFELEARCGDFVLITGASGHKDNAIKICGNDFGQRTLSFRLIGDSLTFRFSSDIGLSFAGFVMKYTVTPQSATMSAETAMIASISAATGLLMIVIALAVTVCILKRRLNRIPDAYTWTKASETLQETRSRLQLESNNHRSLKREVDHQIAANINQARPLPRINSEEDQRVTEAEDTSGGYVDRIERQGALADVYDGVSD